MELDVSSQRASSSFWASLSTDRLPSSLSASLLVTQQATSTQPAAVKVTDQRWSVISPTSVFVGRSIPDPTNERVHSHSYLAESSPVCVSPRPLSLRPSRSSLKLASLHHSPLQTAATSPALSARRKNSPSAPARSPTNARTTRPTALSDPSSLTSQSWCLTCKLKTLRA